MIFVCLARTGQRGTHTRSSPSIPFSRSVESAADPTLQRSTRGIEYLWAPHFWKKRKITTGNEQR